MLTGLSSALAGVSLWKEQRGLRAQAMEGEAAETKRPLGRPSDFPKSHSLPLAYFQEYLNCFRSLIHSCYWLEHIIDFNEAI